MKILITGCSSGIGRELCRQFKEKGHTIIATARNLSSLSDIDADMKLKLDVTSQEDISNVLCSVTDKYGSIDILINNAGYSERGSIEEISIEHAQNVFEVNVFGMLRMIKAFTPMFRESKKGKIINIGSVSGLYTQPANGIYCASKHAVEAITDAVRMELSTYNVKVCVLEPGPMETEFFHTLSKNSDDLMNNVNSPYYKIYESNIKTRDTQKQCPAKTAASEMVDIILKPSLKLRYLVAISHIYKIGIKLRLMGLYNKLHK